MRKTDISLKESSVLKRKDPAAFVGLPDFRV
jgi:hypothetical protein